MVRYACLVSSAILLSVVQGCGGSGGTSNGGGGGSSSLDAPVLTSIAPSTAQAGAPATTILAYGSNFQNGVTIEWNGTALSTSCVDSSNIIVAAACTSTTVLTASIPASDLVAAGSAKITLFNPNPDGGTSSSVPFTIKAPSATTTWVRAISGITAPQDIVWDANHGKLYASIGSTDTVAPNTIVAIDPIAGTAGTPVSAGSNPDQLSISSDSSYLWTGLDGSGSVQRFLLPGLTKDISFPLPLNAQGGSQSAVCLQADPFSPHTAALVAGLNGGGNGVYIYDDATQRHNYVPGYVSPGGSMIDWIQWGSGDSTIYGDQDTTIDEGGIANLSVNSSGVSLVNYNGGQLNPTISQYDNSNGLLYSYGGAYDPVKLTQIGQFDLPITGGEACTADSSLNRYYCVTTYSVGGTDVTAMELWVFNLNTYALLNRVYFGEILGESTSQPDTSVTGSPQRLVRWGNAGLALITKTDPYQGNGGIYLIDGAGVNPSAPPDTTFGHVGKFLRASHFSKPAGRSCRQRRRDRDDYRYRLFA